jgi:hypothetical protein
MTCDEAIQQLSLIQNAQATFKQDEAVKYAIAILKALAGEM